MPDLLLELRSEEIPARMQRKAAGDLKSLVTNALVEAGLTYEGAREYWTPRRLTLDIRGLEAKSKDAREERKGPKVGAPQPAIDGFLRASGLASIDEATIQSDKKGDFYIAVTMKPGRPAEEIVAEIVPAVVREFPWPKSMRWGPASAKAGSMRWVRPLQSILCVFGPENGETVVVDFEVNGIRSGNRTVGHRFHAPEEFAVRRFDDYVAKLEAAKVVLDAERRKEIIRADAQNLAFAQGLEVVEDEGLLEEVSGLVEWPVVLMGEFEDAFLGIPPEMIRLTIRANQKCFVLRAQGGQGLTNRFLLVSNIEASDGGVEIARGNGKVVRARLSDALYFWNTDQADLPDLQTLRETKARGMLLKEDLGLDLSKSLDQRTAKLDALGVTFHAKLGTQGERVRRIVELTGTLAPLVGADPAMAKRAALLAKADLTTEAVGEFPELQGLMGRKYAALQGEPESVQAAIEDHYKPLGPGDRVPTDPVAVAVALADKLDTLVGFWTIDERPTGSKDPYALRRAALGVIRIIVENRLRLSASYGDGAFVGALLPLMAESSARHVVGMQFRSFPEYVEAAAKLERRGLVPAGFQSTLLEKLTSMGAAVDFSALVADSSWLAAKSLMEFLQERLKVQLRENGARPDLVDSVLASGEDDDVQDDLLDIASRVAALGSLLASEDGQNLLAAYRRAANILAAEEKKGTRIGAEVSPSVLVEPEEIVLLSAVEAAEAELAPALQAEDYERAMAALARLRRPADAFFDKVLVNAEDDDLRANRLALLMRIRQATERVADFSKITGA